MNTATFPMAGARRADGGRALLGWEGNAHTAAALPAAPDDDDSVPAWEVDFPLPAGSRPPCCQVLLALATGNWQPFFDGLTHDADGLPIFPEFECAGAAPF